MVEVLGQPCHLCQMQEICCSYTEAQIPPATMPGPINDAGEQSFRTQQSMKRPYSALQENSRGLQSPDPVNTNLPHDRPNVRRRDNVTALNTPNQSAYIVGPVLTNDAHVLEQYMSPGSPGRQRTADNPYRVYSADPNMPVLYTKIERRRRGLSIAQEPGLEQKEILDQILAPDPYKLLHLYVNS